LSARASSYALLYAAASLFVWCSAQYRVPLTARRVHGGGHSGVGLLGIFPQRGDQFVVHRVTLCSKYPVVRECLGVWQEGLGLFLCCETKNCLRMELKQDRERQHVLVSFGSIWFGYIRLVRSETAKVPSILAIPSFFHC